MLTKLEVRRQTVHLLFGLILVGLIYFDLINAAVLFVLLFVLFIVSDLVNKGIKIPFISLLFDSLERKSERKGMRAKGMFFYILGSALALILFPKDIAMASIMILAFGDSVSRLVGPYGYLKHPFNNKKFIEGVVAGGVAAAFGAAFFVDIISAVFASAISMFIESLDIEINNFRLDDNFTIPIIAGTVIYVLNYVL